MKRNGTVCLLAVFAACMILPRTFSGPPDRTAADAGGPELSDRYTCICDHISRGGVGWCGRWPA